jgi:DNA polymerase-3 subunit alpha
MIDDFIQRKQGQRAVSYELAELQEILEETYGVIVYQEQVMQIANRLAGFSLGEADILRRAMGKKKRVEMRAQREKFIAGAKRNKIPEKKAAKVFDLMAEFAGYGFNKSHSAAYALLAYHTAYLKTHYPVEFMAALLTAETGSTETVVKYIHECREMGITVLPPDINESDWSFTPTGEAIRFGLGAVRNVGYNTVQAVQEARQRLGRFTSLFEFCDEVDLRVLNRRVLESLVKSGAMDSLGSRRAQLVAAIDAALERAGRRQRQRASGQHGLFVAGGVEPAPLPALPEVEEWPEHERLRYEKEILGFFITGHPLARYADRLRELRAAPIAELEERRSGDDVSLAGIVVKVRPMRSKKGDRWAIATLEDMTGVTELLVFPEAFARVESRLYPDAALVVKGKVRHEESGLRITVQELLPREEAVRRVVIRLDLTQVSTGMVERLLELFERKPGRVAVALELEQARDYRVRLDPQQPLRVEADEELLTQLRSLCGESAVSLLS